MVSSSLVQKQYLLVLLLLLVLSSVIQDFFLYTVKKQKIQLWLQNNQLLQILLYSQEFVSMLAMYFSRDGVGVLKHLLWVLVKKRLICYISST